MSMTDFEKLIWEELKSLRGEMSNFRSEVKDDLDSLEDKIGSVQEEMSNLKTSQAISKVKVGGIITILSTILSTVFVAIIKKVF